MLGFGNQALCPLPATNKPSMLLFLLFGGRALFVFTNDLKTGSCFQEHGYTILYTLPVYFNDK